MKPLLSLACTTLLLTPALVNADDTIDELRVTGTHIPDTTELGRVPKFTIAAEEIAALAPNSFADILRGVPGLDIMQQGGLGGLTFLSVRGGDPNFVTILIDGVKVNDPTNSRGGAFDLGTLDPAIIEKVDVFYGSYSPVYGSDALAGVVSITTKSGEEGYSGSASIKAGSGSMFGGNAHVALPIGDAASLSLAGSYQDNDDSTFGDAFDRKEFMASLRSKNNEHYGWSLGMFYADGASASLPEDSGGDRLALIATPETRDFKQVNASGNTFYKFTPDWRLSLNAAWSRRNEIIDNPGIAPGVLSPVPAIASDSEYERFDLSLANSIEVADIATIAIGGAFASEDGGMDSFIDFGFPVPANYTLSRKTYSLFAEAGIDPVDNLHITTGIRYDEADQVKATTGRFIARYYLSAGSVISAQFSQGFKLPSFFALGHPFVGNTDLRAERSENYDLSIEQKVLDDKVSVTASIYKNTFKDLVDFDPILFTNVNRSKVEAKGVELFVAVKASHQLSLSGSISHNKMDTFEPDVSLRRRPEWKGSLQVNYRPIKSVTVMARMTMNGDYFDSSIPTGVITMDGYTRADLSLSWDIMKGTTIRLNANNVFDNKYEEAVGFANMGRSITASLSKNF